jgi:hypothetical protein
MARLKKTPDRMSLARSSSSVSFALGGPARSQNMNIVPPSRRPQEMRVRTRPKALVLTGVSVVWVLICIGAWSFDYSQAIRILALAMQVVLLTGSVCLWRFEQPREARFKDDFGEPPVIHGS